MAKKVVCYVYEGLKEWKGPPQAVPAKFRIIYFFEFQSTATGHGISHTIGRV